MTSQRTSFDRLTRLAVRTLQVPIAVISLQAQNQVWVESASASSPLAPDTCHDLAAALSGLSYRVLSNAITILHGVNRVGRSTLPPIAEQPICFYAGVPLTLPNGECLGALCVADSVPREFSSEDTALLEDLAAIALDQLTLQRATRQTQQLTTTLDQTKAELNALYRSLDDVILVLNTQGQFLKAAPTTLGLQPPTAGLVGKTLHQVFELEQADLFLSLIDYTLSSQEAVTIEYSLPIDGQEVWLAAKISPLTPNSVLWVARDISDRERAEDLLTNSAAQIHLIIDSVPARIAYIGRDLRYRFVNRQYEDWFQIPAAEIVGKHVRELLGEPIFQANRPLIDAALAGEEVTLQDSLMSPDGIEHHFQVAYVPNFGKQGTVLGYYVLAQDITDQKRVEEVLRNSEAELRALFAAMTDLIFVLDRQGRYLKIAPTRPDLLYGPAEDIVGKTIHQVLPQERADACLETIRAALDSQRTVNIEYSLEIEGRVLWFSTNVSPLAHDSVICVARDITDRKQAELQINQALHEKDILLREIHHRVKNNLQIVASLLDLQSQFAAHPAIESAMRESQNRLRSMALIHEHLYHSSELGQINLPKYIEALVSCLIESYAIQPDQVRFHLAIAPLTLDLDQVVPCGLVINELVSNALKHGFSANKTGAIQVRLFQQSPHQAALVVSNNGVPFPAEIDFRQAKTLGLQLVNNLVEQLEGSIELESWSEPTFKIQFPLLASVSTLEPRS